MISGAALVIDSIGEDLAFHFGDELRGGSLDPARGFDQLRQRYPDHEEADQVRQVMVARHDRRGLEILFDESGVGDQELCDQGERGFVEQNGIAKQVEGRYYVDRPYGSFHRDGPVYTKVGRILPVPGRNLYQELLGESL